MGRCGRGEHAGWTVIPGSSRLSTPVEPLCAAVTERSGWCRSGYSEVAEVCWRAKLIKSDCMSRE